MAKGRRPKFTMAQVADALRASGGIRLSAAKLLQCSRSTITNYIDRSKRLQALEHEIVETNLDIAENALVKGLKDGDKTFVIFFLKTKGKHRGYVERQEVDPILPPGSNMTIFVPEELDEPGG